MEDFVVILITVLTGLLVLRLVLMPIRLLGKLLLHSGCGFLCLWMLNTVSGFTGLYFPINAVTSLTAGLLGVPGVGLLALLERIA